MRRAGGRRGARAPRVSGGRLGPRRRWLPAAGGSAPRRAPHFFFPRRFAQSGSPHFPDPRAPGQREASRIARARAQTTGARAVEKRDVSLLVCTHVRAVCARVCVERDASLSTHTRAQTARTCVQTKRDTSLFSTARAPVVWARARAIRDASRWPGARGSGKWGEPLWANRRGKKKWGARLGADPPAAGSHRRRGPSRPPETLGARAPRLPPARRILWKKRRQTCQPRALRLKDPTDRCPPGRPT